MNSTYVIEACRVERKWKKLLLIVRNLLPFFSVCLVFGSGLSSIKQMHPCWLFAVIRVNRRTTSPFICLCCYCFCLFCQSCSTFGQKGENFINLFVTSKNKTTNSPIHQFMNSNCCIIAREPFKTPFYWFIFHLLLTLKNASLAFSS